jgi:hypothetical protein
MSRYIFDETPLDEIAATLAVRQKAVDSLALFHTDKTTSKRLRREFDRGNKKIRRAMRRAVWALDDLGHLLEKHSSGSNTELVKFVSDGASKLHEFKSACMDIERYDDAKYELEQAKELNRVLQCFETDKDCNVVFGWHTVPRNLAFPTEPETELGTGTARRGISNMAKDSKLYGYEFSTEPVQVPRTTFSPQREYGLPLRAQALRIMTYGHGQDFRDRRIEWHWVDRDAEAIEAFLTEERLKNASLMSVVIWPHVVMELFGSLSKSRPEFCIPDYEPQGNKDLESFQRRVKNRYCHLPRGLYKFSDFVVMQRVDMKMSRQAIYEQLVSLVPATIIGPLDP